MRRQAQKDASRRLSASRSALAHNAEPSRLEIAQTKATRVAHPAYYPGAVPSESFSFRHMKRGMVGLKASSLNDILSEIRLIFIEIPKEILTAIES
jgi:hypothetical protein